MKAGRAPVEERFQLLQAVQDVTGALLGIQPQSRTPGPAQR
ncbi:hypothetical protein ABZX62_08670 [Streptomyces flavidovirens]|uniref:MarR family transcriptional regulator n=1 Tax=Streptomyces flavidovirens TaxID=67298 RepID=A0ABW6RMD3_9ACTN